MADREKVIKGLEEAKEFIRTGSNGSASKICRLMDVCNAAVILLKEQGAKMVIVQDDGCPCCPTCGNELYKFPHYQKYCDECGQAVKWND